MSSWTSVPGSLFDRKTLRQLAVEKCVCFATSYAHQDLHNSFYLSQFKMVRFSFPLNSIEKDLNRQFSSPSTMIGCRFHVSFGRSCCAMASRRW